MLHKIGSMAYKLELSVSSRVNIVFNVCFSKKVILDKISIQMVLLNIDEEGKFILEPKKVSKTMAKELQTRVITK